MAKRIIPSLVRRYAEDAAFQWLIRERAARSPNHSAADMVEVDGRLAAYLDGLRLAGSAGWDLCREELDWKEPGEIFVASVLALESGDSARMAPVAEAVAADPGLARALVSALGWLPWEIAEARLAVFAKQAPVFRYAAVGGAAVHRRWLPGIILPALADSDPAVKARALKACGELGRKDLLPALRKAEESADQSCRFWSAWSTALLDRSSARILSPWAEKAGPHQSAALQILLRAVSLPEALARLDSLADLDIRMRIHCLGWIGAAGRIPWLLEQLPASPLARHGAAAINWIAGAECVPGQLGKRAPTDLEDELEDAGLAGPLDRDYDWPDADGAVAWWARVRGEYDFDKPYAMGEPKGPAAFTRMFSEGKQCHRLGAAIEMALSGPGKPLASCWAPADGLQHYWQGAPLF